MITIECPYCDESDEFDFPEGAKEDKYYYEVCGYCNKKFYYTISFNIITSPRRADCLNGGKHNFKKVVHFPEYYPTWVRCEMCGGEKNKCFVKISE